MKEKIKNWFFSLYYWLYRSGLKKNKLKVMSMEETIEALIDTDNSIVRYGDAEIRMIEGNAVEFQKYDAVLSARLYDILQYKNPKLLVGIPDIFESLDMYTEKSRLFWKEHLFFSRKTYEKYCRKDVIYCNAFLSRLYYIFEDKEACGKWFTLIKKIWNGKKIVIVEGEISHNGIDNDLFDNVNGIERILCPSASAYQVYNQILEACLTYDTERLFLLAVGNTAKVLGADLVDKGYRVIDIGNLDMEYDWYLQGAVTKEHPKKHDYTTIEENLKAGYEEYVKQIKYTICPK